MLQGRGLPHETEVSLTLVDDKAIQKLNRDYRGLDAPTDVLAFSLKEVHAEEPNFSAPDLPNVLGDIVISLETAQRQSEEYGHSFMREIAFLTLHGLLHLLGYDHQEPEEAAKMEQIQEAFLNRWPPFARTGKRID